jgi:hypothetical protein
MNLHEQLGALEMGVDQLIQAVVAPQAENIPETSAETAARMKRRWPITSRPNQKRKTLRLKQRRSR